MTAEPRFHSLSSFRTLLGGELAARGWRLAAVLGLSLAASALALLPPWLAKLLVDDGLVGRRMDLVALYCALMIAAALAGMIVGAGNRWHYLTLSGEILFSLRERVLAHLRRLPPDFVARRGAGEVLSRLDGDVAEIQRFAVDSLLAAVNAVLVLAGMVAMMALIAPVLMLPALVLLPLQVMLARRLRPRVEAMTRAVRQRNGEQSGYLVEALRTVKLTAAMGAEAREAERFAGLNRRYLSELRRAEMLGMAAAGLPALCNGLAAAGVFLLGGGMVTEGALSLGSLLAFSLYLGRAGGPVNTLTGLILAQRRARVSLERIGEILGRRPAVEAPAHPRRLPADARGTVELHGVAFAHPGGEAVLSGASAHFPAGGKTGIVGTSGAGKSTLIDLLHRHYDPDAGAIRLDGIDLRHLDPAELRRRVAVVDQEPALVAGTVADNIRLAAPEASDQAVAEAARRAELGGLPLDRPIGEGGVALSGGERQRVAIARALLRDPLVLILDEAASAVDVGTCRRIARTIDTLFAGRTRIVISHHPEMLERADAVLELGGGRLTPRRAEPAA
jgi:ATP-binding cassette subfamily B protein